MPAFKVDMFLLGCLGGLVPDVLRIIKNKSDANVLQCFKHFSYWVALILQMALGGFAVYILSTASITKALAVGFSAPEIIGALLGKKEEVRVAATKGERKFNVRSWLAG